MNRRHTVIVCECGTRLMVKEQYHDDFDMQVTHIVDSHRCRAEDSSKAEEQLKQAKHELKQWDRVRESMAFLKGILK